MVTSLVFRSLMLGKVTQLVCSFANYEQNNFVCEQNKSM